MKLDEQNINDHDLIQQITMMTELLLVKNDSPEQQIINVTNDPKYKNKNLAK